MRAVPCRQGLAPQDEKHRWRDGGGSDRRRSGRGAFNLRRGRANSPKSPSAEVRTGAAPVALPPVEKPALERFTTALDAFNAHDKANDWTDQACADTARMFEGAASAQSKGKLPEATFDAGLAYQRCGNDKEARHFQQAFYRTTEVLRSRSARPLSVQGRRERRCRH